MDFNINARIMCAVVELTLNQRTGFLNYENEDTMKIYANLLKSFPYITQ